MVVPSPPIRPPLFRGDEPVPCPPKRAQVLVAMSWKFPTGETGRYALIRFFFFGVALLVVALRVRRSPLRSPGSSLRADFHRRSRS